jgi:hypothetical protein
VCGTSSLRLVWDLQQARGCTQQHFYLFWSHRNRWNELAY